MLSSLLSLLNKNFSLAVEILKNPSRNVRLFEMAIQHAQNQVMALNGQQSILMKKANVHVRFTGLPMCSGTFHNRIPGVEVADRLVAIRGTVTRLGPIRMVDRAKTFECSKCKIKVEVQGDDHQYGVIARPAFCNNQVEDERCNSTKFDSVNDPNGKSRLL